MIGRFVGTGAARVRVKRLVWEPRRAVGSWRGLCTSSGLMAEPETADEGAVSRAYDELVEVGKIRDDSSQRVTLGYLDKLYGEVLRFDKHRLDEVERYDRLRLEELNKETGDAAGSFFGSFFGSSSGSDTSVPAKPVEKPRVQGVPTGLYICGGPGSGKTFLMDTFYAELPIKGKRRVHFNEFMLGVHRTLYRLQKKGLTGDTMIEKCVEELYSQGWVLCFDEFQITDIADAMVVRRLFEALLDRGVVSILTSNRQPDDLYKNGIQRDLFVPFIDDIKKRYHVLNMNSDLDYRMLLIDTMGATSENNESSVYFVSKGPGVGQSARFERLYDKLVHNDTVYDSTLTVQGRKIVIPQAGRHEDVARFTFDDLCNKPLGASDYYAIAASFHTIFIDEVPQLDLTMINNIRRFIVMIDTFYDQKCVVVISAKVPMDNLLDTSFLRVGDDDKHAKKEAMDKSNVDEVFAFERCISRIHDMQKPAYLLKAKTSKGTGVSGARFLSQIERVEHATMTSGDIKLLWDRYDKNQDGVIDDEELKSMLEEITLYRSGHKHVPDEVLVSTRTALHGDHPEHEHITWDNFKNYFENYGLTTRG
mmetsp:Transcript_3248/g.6020  ORF Transcript_3248/g.6020 Transcript_3248/m.6020 type:complete len:591 (+) Transcript_3248:168-1940(+)|eukprot:CAMPEP_0203749246 /NCGR_PEP_ID=MMETSP0098-20131031/3877_1 /ASSEMBLY_ACC=CAM_ASM_000208 /TAXON_ID=96639 /ORGANISM=" , Strain NY0313808BC1" /LENGTH=590 /DNA_ID=CAMNT_0050638245 /DNA_START=138 /DNA_END=1910 /DNA_ORIENTATION=+